MCEAAVAGDTVVFSAPELELSVAYLAARNIADVKLREGALYITPALAELVDVLKSICHSDVSTLLLDLKESLLHLGWLVDGKKDVVKIRKSKREDVFEFTTVEYNKLERMLSILTTRLCLADFLQREGFQIRHYKYILEAWRKIQSLPEAIEFMERLPTC